jgi:hypothetical protein
LGILWDLFGIISMLATFTVDRPGAADGVSPIMLGLGIDVALLMIAFLVSILVFIGAIKMKNLSSYSFAMAAAIMAMIPCVSPCCFLGWPFGIWALVVLSDSSVKAAFRS